MSLAYTQTFIGPYIHLKYDRKFVLLFGDSVLHLRYANSKFFLREYTAKKTPERYRMIYANDIKC